MFFFTDEQLKKLAKGKVHIEGQFYRVVTDPVTGEITNDGGPTDFKLGDVVLDKKDGMWGIIDFIHDGKCAFGSNGVTEVRVPLTRLIKLELISP